MQPKLYEQINNIFKLRINKKRNSQHRCEIPFFTINKQHRKGVKVMPLEQKDQMNLLKDILTNHSTDCCGSVSECEQLERLVKSLMVNTNIDHSVKNVLEQVYSYSQSGVNTNELDQHITSHQEQLGQWVSEIDQFS